MSRPPLWFASAFAYSFGVASEATVKETTFWWGLLYCTFPFNLMLCGLNDVADWDVDHVNPKRNSAWRRCVDESQLGSLAFWSLALQVPCFLWILGNADKGTWHATAWVVSAGLQVSLYNGFCGLPQTSRISLMDLPMNVWAWLLPVHFAWLMHDAVAVGSKHGGRNKRQHKQTTHAALLCHRSIVLRGRSAGNWSCSGHFSS